MARQTPSARHRGHFGPPRRRNSGVSYLPFKLYPLKSRTPLPLSTIHKPWPHCRYLSPPLHSVRVHLAASPVWWRKVFVPRVTKIRASNESKVGEEGWRPPDVSAVLSATIGWIIERIYARGQR